MLKARHPGLHGTPAIIIAFAVAAMRIRIALRVCDIIYTPARPPLARWTTSCPSISPRWKPPPIGWRRIS
ncbi:hypothetical protein ABK249_20870 [Neorhizobium sp. Rsf11]|uniref:Uncharacterized protein n=1 Tax=Neorhizobium phenanthreniclasticum TaxID=3157917 RepID=A0ABV0M676_9HYPH